MKNSQQGFARTSIIIAAFIALLIVALWIYIFKPACFCLDPDAVPPPPPEMVRIINESREWETYRNEEYGFEFKYPNNIILSTTSNAWYGDSLQIKLSSGDYSWVMNVFNTFKPEMVTQNGMVIDNKNDLKTVVVDGVILHRTSYGDNLLNTATLSVCENNDINTACSFISQKGSKAFSLRYTRILNENESSIFDENILNIFDKISSTFTFVSTISDKDKYKSEKYGFEISKKGVIEVEEKEGLENIYGPYSYVYFGMPIGPCKEGCSNSVSVYTEVRDSIKSFDDVKVYVTKTYPVYCDGSYTLGETCVYEIKETTLSGQSAMYVDMYDDPGTYPTRSIEYYLFKNGKLYTVRGTNTDDAKNLISTFKFTN